MKCYHGNIVIHF